VWEWSKETSCGSWYDTRDIELYFEEKVFSIKDLEKLEKQVKKMMVKQATMRIWAQKFIFLFLD